MGPKTITATRTPVTSDEASDDALKLTLADFDGAKLRVAGRAVSRAEWQVAASGQP